MTHEIVFIKKIQFYFTFSMANECFQRYDFYGVEYVFRAKIRWRKFSLYLPEQTCTSRAMTHVMHKVSTWCMDMYWLHCCVVKEKEFRACVNRMPDAKGKSSVTRPYFNPGNSS